MKLFKLFIFAVILVTLSACGEGGTGNILLNGAPPVYQGMQVSDKNFALSTNTAFALSKIYESSQDIIDSIPSIDIPEQDDLIYFASLNEEIFVNVRLFNPDGQVILRFTLNGVIYQSFQFEEGSNSELLVIKVNAGNLSGIKELTIDEIKYVENETNALKDAIFDGNRTIKIGVAYENLISAEFSNVDLKSTHYRSNINIIDLDNLMTVYENPAVFYLFDGTSVIYTQVLTVGNNTIDYPYLHPATTYEYAIASTYDLLDGEGPQVYLATQNTFTTENIVSITSITPQQESLSFELNLNDENEVGNLTSIELYQGDTLIESLSNLSIRTFVNLLSNNAYEIKVTYTYDLNNGMGEQTFNIQESSMTIEKIIPEINISIDLKTKETIVFSIDIFDDHETGFISSIELYQGETLVESLTNLSIRTFENLNSNIEYEIKVTYTYDLNDGNGEFIITQSITQITTAYLITYYDFPEISDGISHIILNPAETIKDIQFSQQFASLLTSDSRVLMWGNNQFGQLGDGTTKDSYVPVDITSRFNLENGETITQISLNVFRSFALTSLGRLFTWGEGTMGIPVLSPIEITYIFELEPNEIIKNIITNFHLNVAITSDNRVYEWTTMSYMFFEANTSRDITPLFNLDSDEYIIEIKSGFIHSIAFSSKNKVFTWGFNQSGQLGNGTLIEEIAPQNITSNLVLNSDESILKVFAGNETSGILTSNGRVFTWGRNIGGELGNGGNENSSIPIEITNYFELNPNEIITNIFSGSSTYFAITNENRIFGWGLIMQETPFNGEPVFVYYSTPRDISENFILNENETVIKINVSLGYSALTSEDRFLIWGRNQYGELLNGMLVGSAVPTEIVIYYLNVLQIVEYNYGEEIEPLLPQLDGFIFNGWFTDFNFTNKYEFTTMPAENIILYAKWIKE